MCGVASRNSGGVSEDNDYRSNGKRRGIWNPKCWKRTLKSVISSISREALPGEAWVKQTTWDDSRELCESNGDTDAPPSDDVVVWGLRSTETGRWIGINDVYGEECLLVFRTRELAERYTCDSNEVVWMRPANWWRKVVDAAKTGYPPRVNLLHGIENGHTDRAHMALEDLGPGRWVAGIYPEPTR